MYLLREGSSNSGAPKKGRKDAPRVQLLGSGTILNEVIAAAELLESDFGVASDVWSCPSFTELGRDGMNVERWNMLHPGEERKTSFVAQCLGGRPAGPVIASTDYMRAFADQIRPYVDRRYRVLGTDGFGRSDYRVNLRRHFEVDRHHVVLAALGELAAEGSVPASAPADAIAKYGIDPDKPAAARA
jgi:pyruvate dehydrogenase E1 component